MILFIVGILEMLIVTVWTKAVTKTKVMASGAITLINVLVWYYVLQTIISDVSNWSVAFMYALGCAIGTMLATLFFWRQETKNLKKL